MIYLDYSATTPMSIEAMDTMMKVSKDFIGNPNSFHKLGVNSKELMESATKQISELLKVKESEIVYTSGATESNNMAFLGVAFAYKNRGNHILVSSLEHPSIYGICDYLKTLGFEIEMIQCDQEGLIDFDDLKRKMRDETILVSVVGVNSEMGIRQPLKMIRQIIKKENATTIFHSDMTQALGKIPVNAKDVDLASFSFHKIYGPKGIGLLYKSEKVQLVPLLHGSGNGLRPGTPAVSLIASASKSLRLALQDLERKETFVEKLNEKIVKEVSNYEGILINQTSYSIPHILNISLPNIKPETFIHALEDYEIYIGTNTACASGEISNGVLAIYDDKKRASSTIRISLSYLTTTDEINRFLHCFDLVFKRLGALASKQKN